MRCYGPMHHHWLMLQPMHLHKQRQAKTENDIGPGEGVGNSKRRPQVSKVGILHSNFLYPGRVGDRSFCYMLS